MPIFRGSGGSGDASTDAYISEVAAFANTATLKASEASASASSASGFADAASASASAASTSADDASNAQTAAELAETNAEAAEAAAVIAQTGAETAEALAEQWATELEDVVVADGKYSAFHWAQKAEDAFIIGTEINSLSDVTITTVTDNEVLAYNAGTSEWVNQTAAEAGLATSAQGSLADTAVQPNDSPSFGSITVSGTVDGRDLSVDGAKLDGIEALADVTDTANVTAAGALMDSELADITAIKTFQAPDNTTISAYGATLVDDADAGTARTTLGLGTAATATVTTSATDTTAGRLTKVGDFGLGVVDQGAVISGDWNDFPTTYPGNGIVGLISIGQTNAPPLPSFYYLEQRFFLNDRVLQIAWPYRVNIDKAMYIRSNFDGTWAPWREIYNSGTILGTVSQSAGVPTGALMEYGSNANGEYWKYAGGMMVCTRNIVYASQALTGNSFLNLGAAATAATFATIPRVSAQMYGGYAYDYNTTTQGATTTSFGAIVAVKSLSSTSRTQEWPVGFIAIGRWF